MQINKSDRNDAAGIARIMQTGWFKAVQVKDLDSHAVRALLASRALLVKIKRDLENHIRGLLQNLGLVIGRAKFNVFAVRAGELVEDRPELIALAGQCSTRVSRSSGRLRYRGENSGPGKDMAGSLTSKSGIREQYLS